MPLSASPQSLMSTTAFGLGSKYFALYEMSGVGIQWHTFSQSPVEGDDFNLLLSMMMLIVDAVVYGVLTWYIEAVHPGGVLGGLGGVACFLCPCWLQLPHWQGGLLLCQPVLFPQECTGSLGRGTFRCRSPTGWETGAPRPGTGRGPGQRGPP